MYHIVQYMSTFFLPSRLFCSCGHTILSHSDPPNRPPRWSQTALCWSLWTPCKGFMWSCSVITSKEIRSEVKQRSSLYLPFYRVGCRLTFLLFLCTHRKLANSHTYTATLQPQFTPPPLASISQYKKLPDIEKMRFLLLFAAYNLHLGLLPCVG